jgi:hypothetical protein
MTAQQPLGAGGVRFDVDRPVGTHPGGQSVDRPQPAGEHCLLVRSQHLLQRLLAHLDGQRAGRGCGDLCGVEVLAVDPDHPGRLPLGL